MSTLDFAIDAVAEALEDYADQGGLGHIALDALDAAEEYMRYAADEILHEMGVG